MITVNNHAGSTVINQHTAEVQHNYAPSGNQASVAALLVQIKRTLDSDHSLSESQKAAARIALEKIAGETTAKSPSADRIIQWAKSLEGIAGITSSVKGLLSLLLA